jgi:hypothetical protein
VDDDYTMKFQGTVTAIEGNKVKLDSPIYSELRRSLSQATSRHSGAGVLSECGILRMFEWSARMLHLQTS